MNEAAAKAALENLRRDFGKKSPGLVAAWDRAWDQFVPFLEFDSAIRKVIYTTNAIESVNFQLRKIIKNRGHFPDDDAAIKLNTRDFRCFVLPGVLWSWCSVRALESVSIWCVVMVLARVSRRGWRAVPRAAVVPPS